MIGSYSKYRNSGTARKCLVVYASLIVVIALASPVLSGSYNEEHARLAPLAYKAYTEDELVELAEAHFSKTKQISAIKSSLELKEKVVVPEKCGLYHRSIIQAAIEAPDISADTKRILEDIITASMPTLERTYDISDDPSLTHFFIKYTLQGGTLHNPDGAINPPDSDGDGHPDYIEAIATQLENSLTVEVTTLGFDSPFDTLIEVRVFDKGYEPGTGGLVGVAYIEWGQIVIDIDNNHPNTSATVCHELFHTIQMTMDPAWLAPWINEEWWIIEGTARWMEDGVYDEQNSYILNGGNYFLQNTDSILTSAVSSNRVSRFLKIS